MFAEFFACSFSTHIFFSEKQLNLSLLPLYFLLSFSQYEFENALKTVSHHTNAGHHRESWHRWLGSFFVSTLDSLH